MQSGAHMFYKEKDAYDVDQYVNQTKQIAKQLNCSEADDWIQCLRGIDAKEFQKYSAFQVFPFIGTEFRNITAQKAFDDMKFNSGMTMINSFYI